MRNRGGIRAGPAISPEREQVETEHEHEREAEIGGCFAAQALIERHAVSANENTAADVEFSCTISAVLIRSWVCARACSGWRRGASRDCSARSRYVSHSCFTRTRSWPSRQSSEIGLPPPCRPTRLGGAEILRVSGIALRSWHGQGSEWGCLSPRHIEPAGLGADEPLRAAGQVSLPDVAEDRAFLFADVNDRAQSRG